LGQILFKLAENLYIVKREFHCFVLFFKSKRRKIFAFYDFQDFSTARVFKDSNTRHLLDRSIYVCSPHVKLDDVVLVAGEVVLGPGLTKSHCYESSDSRSQQQAYYALNNI
jgi:hypothetical protein